MAVPYTFGTATASIPLSQLDSNFATVITLGNTAIQLGNTVTTLNNMTLANVTISSGNLTLTNVSATTANVTTANVVTLIVTGNETVQGNTTVTGTITGAKLIPTGTSVTGNGMYLPATNSVGISTAGTNAVYIDASQNVGIGTGSPTAKLQVAAPSSSGAVSNGFAITNGGSGSGTGSSIFIGYNTTIGTYGSVSGFFDGTGTALTFGTTPSAGGSAVVERMRISSAGDVGIGTNVPTSSGAGYTVLQVNNATSGGQLHLTGGGSGATATDGTILTQAGGDFYINNQEAGPTIFYNNGAERMRIDSSGNLLVGTTSTISGARVGIANVNGGQAGVGIGNTVGTSASTCISFRNSNGEVGFIQTSGSLTTYSVSSDYRLKNTIVPMTGALNKVTLLKPVTYKWNSDGTDGEGFIAHELAEICPQAVVGEKDAVDAEGNPKYQGIDTSFLVATLTAAIQELKALVDTQASTITSLTARITALEAA